MPGRVSPDTLFRISFSDGGFSTGPVEAGNQQDKFTKKRPEYQDKFRGKPMVIRRKANARKYGR